MLSEPIGARRQDHVTLLDLRVDKDIRVAGANQITAFVELFNTLNANPEQNVNWETGAAFLSPRDRPAADYTRGLQARVVTATAGCAASGGTLMRGGRRGGRSRGG